MTNDETIKNDLLTMEAYDFYLNCRRSDYCEKDFTWTIY